MAETFDKYGGGWWCPTCHRSLMPAEVTYNETHDVREGGCGEPVGSVPRSAIESIKAVAVTAPDGSPVSAPCAIEGCQYKRLAVSHEGDSAETVSSNPQSWIAWKRRAEQLERALAKANEKFRHEQFRADCWVNAARCLARDLGLADEDSKGSTQDWKLIQQRASASSATVPSPDEVISKIISDIRGRSGLDAAWDEIDVDIRNEIVAEWRSFFNSPERTDHA